MGRLLILAANLLPLAGVWLWGWDVFQVLMLYWAETVILAGWTLARIATLPADLLGTLKVNGRERRGTNLTMTLFFAFHAGMFITVHLIFLLVLFSGDWSDRMTRPLSFLYALFIESGAWAPLILAFLGGLIGFVTAIPQPALVTRLMHRLDPRQPAFSRMGSIRSSTMSDRWSAAFMPASSSCSSGSFSAPGLRSATATRRR